MALAQYYLVLFLFIHCYASTVSTIESFVIPSNNITCPAQPCLTLDEYARSADQFFRDNTTFHFLSGSHQLDTNLRLENVSNVVFTIFDSMAANDTIIHLTPLVNITWSDCSNTEVRGIVFILSGGDSIVNPFFSALVLQRTTCSLSRLTLLGNRSSSMRSNAIRMLSSRVKISDVMVLGATSPYGAALDAFNCTVDFLGHNIFINNTAAQGGAIYFQECISNNYGNITFINNSAITFTSIYRIYPKGGAIYSYNSSVSFSGSAWFQHNQATGSPYFTPTYYASDGAISLSSSTLTFQSSSETVFLENTAVFVGGVMSVFSSELIMQGKALFERNIAGQAGSAIKGGNNSRIFCWGRNNITFRSNYVSHWLGYGGAIDATSTNVELQKISFEGNIAGFGGAVYCRKSDMHISTCEFVNDTAIVTGGAVNSGAGTMITFDGVNNFRRNLGQYAGAVNIYNASATFMEENIFSNNNASLGSGCLDIVQSNLHFVENVCFTTIVV